jgi:DNA segregation ATPase FtsK/SpoIIIE, S-DNA-T family
MTTRPMTSTWCWALAANGDDALYDQAVAIVAKDRKCSTSYIQRKLGIGYNKAARLVEQMEEQASSPPPTTSASARSCCPNTDRPHQIAPS